MHTNGNKHLHTVLLLVLSDALRAASAKETVKLLLAEKRQFRQELVCLGLWLQEQEAKTP